MYIKNLILIPLLLSVASFVWSAPHTVKFNCLKTDGPSRHVPVLQTENGYFLCDNLLLKNDHKNSIGKKIEQNCNDYCEGEAIVENGNIIKILSIGPSSSSKLLEFSGHIEKLDRIEGEFKTDTGQIYTFPHEQKPINFKNPSISDLLRTYCAPNCTVKATISIIGDYIQKIHNIETELYKQKKTLIGSLDDGVERAEWFAADDGELYSLAAYNSDMLEEKCYKKKCKVVVIIQPGAHDTIDIVEILDVKPLKGK